MAFNKTNFLVADNTRDPSPVIWGQCPVDDILENPSKGWHFYDDFKDFPLPGTQTTQIGFGKYKLFATASASIAPVHSVNSVDTGIVQVNNVVVSTSATLAQSYGMARLSGVVGTDGKLWFEARVAVQTLAATTQGFFLGLAETDKFTLATAVPLNGSAATLNNSGAMIGFQAIETGPTAINTVVSDRATAFTNIQAGVAATQPGSFGSTAYTFTKLGFIYDPSKSANCITFYQDGVPFTTFYSQTSLLATTNLKANSLAMMLAVLGTGTGAVYTQWWRCAQLYP